MVWWRWFLGVLALPAAFTCIALVVLWLVWPDPGRKMRWAFLLTLLLTGAWVWQLSAYRSSARASCRLLLAQIDSSYLLERELHRAVDSLRVTGESAELRRWRELQRYNEQTRRGMWREHEQRCS